MGRLRCPGTVWEPMREANSRRNSLGNTLPQSPYSTEPLWTNPGLKSETGVCELISTLKEEGEEEERRQEIKEGKKEKGPISREKKKNPIACERKKKEKRSTHHCHDVTIKAGKHV